MNKSHLQHIYGLLLATFFISTSGVLGKYIALAPEVIVWFRSSLAAVFIYIFCRYRGISLRITNKKSYSPFIWSALFMAAHWATYFYALKLSNVALGMLSLYTFPVMTALLEPLFIKVKFNPIHLVLGAMVIVGIYILAPQFTLESDQFKGIIFGLASALFYSIRILILKQQTAHYHGSMLMFYQTLIITIALLPVLFFMDLSPVASQFPYLILIALLTTAIGHTLMVHSLHYFSVSTASIISSIQPVFGMILAFLFLNETPTLNTYLGGALILCTVVIESIRSRKKH